MQKLFGRFQSIECILHGEQFFLDLLQPVYDLFMAYRRFRILFQLLPGASQCHSPFFHQVVDQTYGVDVFFPV